MAAKSIEQKLIDGEYPSPQAARLSIARSRMHGKTKKRLLKIVDNWKEMLDKEANAIADSVDAAVNHAVNQMDTSNHLPGIPTPASFYGAGSDANRMLRDAGLGTVVKLPLSSAYGKHGPSHVSTSALDRSAMLLLVFAVHNKMSMLEAFGMLKQRIDGIGVDGS